MLGFPILYCKGMRPMMFQLSGFCYRGLSNLNPQLEGLGFGFGLGLRIGKSFEVWGGCG